jgi:hypothetical protein
MTWDAAKPAGSQKIRLSDDEIRDNWAALQAALSAEHQFPNTGNDGIHKLPVAASTPAGLEGRLAIVNDRLMWYSNAAWRVLVEPGIKMLFLQAAAPTGWTQDTSINDRVLRLASGVGGGTGGDWTMTSLKTAGHQLTVDELPSHSHSYTIYNNLHYVGSTNENIPWIWQAEKSQNTYNTGGDAPHTHGMDNSGNWRPAYVDVIACTKD